MNYVTCNSTFNDRTLEKQQGRSRQPFLAPFWLLFDLLLGSFLFVWQKNDQKVTEKEMKNEMKNGYCETPGT